MRLLCDKIILQENVYNYSFEFKALLTERKYTGEESAHIKY